MNILICQKIGYTQEWCFIVSFPKQTFAIWKCKLHFMKLPIRQCPLLPVTTWSFWPRSGLKASVFFAQMVLWGKPFNLGAPTQQRNWWNLARSNMDLGIHKTYSGMVKTCFWAMLGIFWSFDIVDAPAKSCTKRMVAMMSFRKIEGPVWYTIYHHLPVVTGVC